MGVTKITLPDLRAAYEAWIGAPAFTLALRRDAIDEAVPTEMDLLFFQPTSEDRLSEEESFTYIATAGMSTRVLPGPCRLAEVVLAVSGVHPRSDLEALGRTLAELAVVPFQEQIPLGLDLVLWEVSLPLFVNMRCLLVTHWGTYEPEWLPGLDPPVQLLCLRPLFASEAEVAEAIGSRESIRRFVEAGVDLDDPGRAPVRLEEFSEITQPKGGEDRMDQTPTAQAVRETWRQIEAWYAEHAPRLREALRDGATERQVAEFEGALGVSLPEDYKASLRVHDGEVYVHDYEYLSIDGARGAWEMMTRLEEEGTFAENEVEDTGEAALQNTWWHRGWIPFAKDSGGNLLCIDTAPGPNGVAGQVLYMEMAAGPGLSEYTSFLEWLEQYQEDLYAGVYEVDEDGLLVERLD